MNDEVKSLKREIRRLKAIIAFYRDTSPPIETRVQRLVAALLEVRQEDDDGS